MSEIVFNEDTHQYFVDGIEKPSVTTILSYITAGHYGSLNQAVLDRARMKGTAVHELCEMYDYGCCPDEVESEIAPYIIAYQTFLRDYKPEWLGIEKIGYCCYGDGFCGTIDRYGMIDDRLTIVDLKTNASPTKENYISVCCQTAAYAMILGDKGTAKRYGVYLKSNGDYRLFDCMEFEKKQGLNVYGLFRQCYELYNTIEKIKEKKK